MNRKFLPDVAPWKEPSKWRPLSPMLLLCALHFASPLLLTAETVSTTIPEGFIRFSFPATTQATTTYISIPLSGKPAFSGLAASVSAAGINFSGTPFVGNAYAQSQTPFFAQVKAGQQAGRTLRIISNTQNSLTLDTTDNSAQTTPLILAGFSIVAGDRIEIFPGDTLASLLGENTVANPLVFSGGTSALNADTISIYNRTTSSFDVFFFSIATNCWRLSSTIASQNALLLPPEGAIGITRRASRPAVSFVLSGRVPDIALRTKLQGSSQAIYVGTRYPMDITFAQLQIPGWTKSNSPLSADTVGVYDPTVSQFKTFYQRTDGTWRLHGATSADFSSQLLPAASAMLLLKRAGVSGAASLPALTLPYEL